MQLCREFLSRGLVIASIVWAVSTIAVLTAALGYFALRHYHPIPDCDELLHKGPRREVQRRPTVGLITRRSADTCTGDLRCRIALAARGYR